MLDCFILFNVQMHRKVVQHFSDPIISITWNNTNIAFKPSLYLHFFIVIFPLRALYFFCEDQ